MGARNPRCCAGEAQRQQAESSCRGFARPRTCIGRFPATGARRHISHNGGMRAHEAQLLLGVKRLLGFTGRRQRTPKQQTPCAIWLWLRQTQSTSVFILANGTHELASPPSSPSLSRVGLFSESLFLSFLSFFFCVRAEYAAFRLPTCHRSLEQLRIDLPSKLHQPYLALPQRTCPT